MTHVTSHDFGPRSEHSPDCAGCLLEEKEWSLICDWETEHHEEHIKQSQFVEACSECLEHGYNKDLMPDILYITPEVSEKAWKKEWADGQKS